MGSKREQQGDDVRYTLLDSSDEESVPVRIVLGSFLVHYVAEELVNLAGRQGVSIVQDAFACPTGQQLKERGRQLPVLLHAGRVEKLLA